MAPRLAPPRKSKNLLLTSLRDEDFRLLAPHLEFVDLPVRKKLEQPNKAVDYVYFVETGIVSIIVGGPVRGIELGLVGPEGMTGLTVLLSADRASNEALVQIAGTANRISAGNLRKALDQSSALLRTLLRYAHSFMAQAAQTAHANGHSKIEERLARWLLMAHDRIEGDELPLTHEFLSIMLGVRRPGVTVALNLLVMRGLIQSQRGVITILDRTGLKKSANGAYA